MLLIRLPTPTHIGIVKLTYFAMQSRSSLSKVEISYNKLVDKYETLKHNSEALLDKVGDRGASDCMH